MMGRPRLQRELVQHLMAQGATLGPSVRIPEEKPAGKRSKYGNVKVDGFDSKKEARVYADLCLAEKAGVVRDLRRQVRFDLFVNGEKVCRYVADFVFERKEESGWVKIVADVKSEATRKIATYRLKKKLMKACYGITLTEL